MNSNVALCRQLFAQMLASLGENMSMLCLKLHVAPQKEKSINIGLKNRKNYSSLNIDRPDVW